MKVNWKLAFNGHLRSRSSTPRSSQQELPQENEDYRMGLVTPLTLQNLQAHTKSYENFPTAVRPKTTKHFVNVARKLGSLKEIEDTIKKN